MSQQYELSELMAWSVTEAFEYVVMHRKVSDADAVAGSVVLRLWGRSQDAGNDRYHQRQGRLCSTTETDDRSIQITVH